MALKAKSSKRSGTSRVKAAAPLSQRTKRHLHKRKRTPKAAAALRAGRLAKRAKKGVLQVGDAGVNALVTGARAAKRKIAAVVHNAALGTATVLNIAAGAGRRRRST